MTAKKYSLGIVGRKAGMSRVFTEDGKSIPVTLIEATPNRITQVKTVETDGYSAVQVTVGVKRAALVNKPEAGHLAKAKVEAGRGLWELRVEADKIGDFQVGGEIKADIFEVGQIVDVQGVTKGKGFQGTIKRWNFTMGDATHGNSLSHRSPGSIGQRQTPGRVFPGKKMSGHMGAVNADARRTCEVVKVDAERGLIADARCRAGRAGRRRDRASDEQGSLTMELAINKQQEHAVGFRRRVRPRIQRRPGPPGRRRLPQRGPRRHQGAEDAFGSQRHHQEVEEAEGRRCASWRADGSDLRRRRRDLRGQAAQLRAEGQPQDVPRARCAAILSELNRQGRIMVVESFDVDAPKTKGLIAKLKGLEVGQASADRHRGSVRVAVPVRAQPAVRRSARRAGPGPGRPRRRRHGRDHRRRGQEDRGVAGMSSDDQNSTNVIRAPRVSEKTARLQEVSNQYVFEVATDRHQGRRQGRGRAAVRRQGRGGERGEREGQEQVLQVPPGPSRRLAQGVRDAGRRPVDRRDDGQGLRTDPWH